MALMLVAYLGAKMAENWVQSMELPLAALLVESLGQMTAGSKEQPKEFAKAVTKAVTKAVWKA